MEQGIKDIEARLLKTLSQPFRLSFEFDANLQSQPEPVVEEVPEERMPEPVESVAPPQPEPPQDPMADFLNDPLIEKALEIFKSTLQTKTS